MRAMIRLFLACLVWSLLTTTGHTQTAVIIVNDVQLSQAQIISYQIAVPAGRYWYDPVSGLWGAEGGPSAGYIAPNLSLGGPLKADASGTGTGVFINGREIHSIEVLRLVELFGGPIQQGRYWLGADGIGGIEGQSASFSIAPQQQQGSGQVFEDEMADFCAEVGGCPW